MTKHYFEPPPKKYRKVTTDTVRLAGVEGAYELHDVTVCLHATKEPTFCVYVPPPYREAWLHHRSSEHSGDYEGNRFTPGGDDGWMHAASHAQVMSRLERLSGNFHRYMAERTMEKVIAIYVELKAQGGRIKVNDPSFVKARVYVDVPANLTRLQAIERLARSRAQRFTPQSELDLLLDADRRAEKAVRGMLGACRVAERSRHPALVEVQVDVALVALLFEVPDAKVPERMGRILA